MPYAVYGVAVFSNTQRRTAASRRLDTRADGAGFTPQRWADLDAWFPLPEGPWPAGWDNVTTSGQVGLRFCYSTPDQAVADAVVNDLLANWNMAEGTWAGWSELPA